MPVMSEQTKLSIDQIAAWRQSGEMKALPADRFCEVVSTRPGVYHLYIDAPTAGGNPWMHLIVGPERALLIDTAYGIGDLKALVETLTDKPYDVVNTHFHGDHSMGNYQFNRVYIHEYDVDLLKESRDPKNRAHFLPPPEKGYCTEEDLVPVRDYEIVGVEDGYVFDLGGGHEVELIHMPGHAPGGCMLLDRKNRMLFSGDAIVGTPTFIFGQLPEGPKAEYMTVRSYRTELQKLALRLGEFDALYPGHAYLGVPTQIVPETVQVCDAILRDPDDFDDEMAFFNRSARIKRIGWASIAYSKERL